MSMTYSDDIKFFTRDNAIVGEDKFAKQASARRQKKSNHV